MLARRVTLLCLLAAILGIGLSTLVAETARHDRSWSAAATPSCVFSRSGFCH
ncbi:hypothetical protein [Zhengella mangrovi]|uniref:hypothetical protein n=1 Tax=Zhengella mangrovi TaxID=1982044 RepID=UPI0013FE1448|nr:hypothetical protein [Zhengella mangrovi]